MQLLCFCFLIFFYSPLALGGKASSSSPLLYSRIVDLVGGSSSSSGSEETESAVVQVTATNFQKMVMESECPVLLDVYADWCGPCKQLTPMLEDTAKSSKGQFRLAKLNSDENQELVKVLNVTGLPTCFAINEGIVTDKFIGGLPPDKLQSFIDRLVTGYGLRASNQVEGAGFQTEWSELTEKLSNYIGMTSLTFSKKEKLKGLVNRAFDLDDDMLEAGKKTPSEALRLTLSYLKNAAKNIKQEKYRIIKTTSKAFSEIISKSSGCKALLLAAGFQLKDGDVSSNLDSFYELRHSNSGIINYVIIYINDAVTRKKYGRS